MTNHIKYVLLRPDHIEQAFSLACRRFVQGSVIHQALGISVDEYRGYIRTPFISMCNQNLSLVAINIESKQVLGCIIAGDYSKPFLNNSALPEKFKPLNAMLAELDSHYRPGETVLPGEIIIVDMAVVSLEALNQGIYIKLRQALHHLAYQAGFKKVISELSSAATQHVCVNKFSQRICHEIVYSQFVYRGQKPFATITDPPSIQLVEGDLAAYQ